MMWDWSRTYACQMYIVSEAIALTTKPSSLLKFEKKIIIFMFWYEFNFSARPPPPTPPRYLSIHACIWGHAAICSSKCIKSPKHFIETQCYGWHDITLFVHCEYVIKTVKMTYV
jgi:hypothetical protein